MRPSPAWPPDWSTSTRCSTGPVGRRPASDSSPGRCSRPDRPSGWAVRLPPRCGGPPGSATGGSPVAGARTWSCWATLRRLRDEFRGGAPIDIGGIADFLYVGTPPTGLELPQGTVAGPAEQVADYLPAFAEAGVGQVQVRFPSRSADELCDQIAAFGREVAPLVGACAVTRRTRPPAHRPGGSGGGGGMAGADMVTLTKAKPSFNKETRGFNRLLHVPTTTLPSRAHSHTHGHTPTESQPSPAGAQQPTRTPSAPSAHSAPSPHSTASAPSAATARVIAPSAGTAPPLRRGRHPGGGRSQLHGLAG